MPGHTHDLAASLRFLLVAVGSLLLCASPGQALVEVPPDGPEQMPLLYVKGFNDDGSTWARSLSHSPFVLDLDALRARKLVESPLHSPSLLMEEAGMRNYAVQWWASDPTGTFASPSTTADDGFAFLQTRDELLEGVDWMNGTWTAQNRPVPSAWDVLTVPSLGSLTWPDDLRESIFPWTTTYFLIEDLLAHRARIASTLRIRNTYNDAGTIDDQAEDLLELLRRARQPGGRLSDARQVNIVAHSKGSLVVRAALSKAVDASIQDAEFVANAIYNAPPWGGSTIAHLNILAFDGPITLAIFDDPILRKIVQEWLDEQPAAVTARDLMIFLLEIFVATQETIQTSVDELVETAGEPARIALDALELLPFAEAGAAIDWASDQVLVALDGSLILLGAIKPVVRSLTGLPARPAADDLTPAAGAPNLLGYTTSAFTKQYTSFGLGGPDLQLFPPDTATVEANPNSIADPAVMVAQQDDDAVAEGSARVLSETAAFGAPIELIPAFPDATHEDLNNESTLLVPMWLARLLAPPTTLLLDGFVTVLSTEDRAYLVDGSSTLDFSAPTVDHTVTFSDAGSLPTIAGIPVQSSASHFEYRVLYLDGSLASGGWETHLPSDPPRAFEDLRTSLDLADVPFFLEWRSVNTLGGREMIRSARISIVGEAPVVTQTVVTTLAPEEVYEPPASNRLGNAVRGDVFDQLAALDPSQLPLLTALRDRPEASYVIRDGLSKALSLGFDKSGSVEYAWDDPSFTSPTRLDDVTALTLAPLDLPEGPHTLYYQTIKVDGPVETRSPLQTIELTIDDTAPEVTFLGVPNHPLGIVVSERSPLHFQIHDLGTHGGTGSVTLDPTDPIVFGEDQVFTLGQTTLRQQLLDAGLVGGFVDLPIVAKDLVANTATRSFQVYYDVTPPDPTLAELVGALPIGPNRYRVFDAGVELAVDLSDAGAGFAEPPEAFVGSGLRAANQSLGPMVLGAVSGHPASFGITLELPFGPSFVQVRATDIAGNVSLLELEVERVEDVFDQEPLLLLSPRLAPDACWDENSVPEPCAQGAIDAVAHSYHGDVFLFASAGERFVAGDANGLSDVFMLRDGELTLVSRAADGSPADGASTRPALSGDGRYAYFLSRAGNLVPGTSDFNFYVKDLESGEVAVLSRRFDGTPANMSGNLSTRPLAPTGNGRYVFFESRYTQHVAGLSDTNGDPDVFMVDLDPDGDGDYFEDDYVTVAISLVSAATTANDLSHRPDVTLDGSALVFRSQATNLHPDLADNGTLADALLMHFSGSADDGTLDVSSPELVPINREAFFGGTSVTAHGVDDVRIGPTTGDVIFSTRTNISGTPDTNDVSTGRDVYLSLGTANPQVRFISWVSKGVGFTNSSNTIFSALDDLAMADDEPVTEFDGNKVGWVSTHTNIVNGDTNGVADLFRAGNDTPVTTGFPVSNWVSPSQPSGAAALLGGFTGNGRWAWWTTPQEYGSPYAPTGVANLYLRRLDPPVTTTLTLTVGAGGSVSRDLPAATPDDPDAFDYTDEEIVRLAAIPDPGFAFAGWTGVDRELGSGTALVRMHGDRGVTASFVATQAPSGASAVITTLEDTRSEGVLPTVTGDPDQSYTFSIVTQPTNGVASVEAGLLVYEPSPDFAGSDGFTFQVTNEFGQSLSAPATASVTVVDVNDPPISTSLALVAAEGIPGCAAAPTVVDPTPGESFGYALVAAPSDGSVAIDGGLFSYTPDPGFVGADDFSYTVTDSGGSTITGFASVDVAAPEDTDGNGAPDLPACMDLDGDDLADVFETDTGSFVSPTDTGTDATNPDSDGDGWVDGEEVALGTDPTDPASFPVAPQVPVMSSLARVLVAALLALVAARHVRRR